MKIKKLLLISALMTTTAYAEPNDFYLRLKLSQFHPQKIEGMAAKPVMIPGVAIGYNISEDMRVDLSMSHITNIRHNGNTVAPEPINDILPPAYDSCACLPIFVHNTKPSVVKSKLTTCKLNLFVDVARSGDTSLYVGGGVGATRIQRAMKVGDVTTNLKPYYTASYDLHAGINHKIKDDLSIGVGYSFKNLTENTYNYKGHSVATSLKLDL